jgi:hypothetical protein
MFNEDYRRANTYCGTEVINKYSLGYVVSFWKRRRLKSNPHTSAEISSIAIYLKNVKDSVEGRNSLTCVLLSPEKID